MLMVMNWYYCFHIIEIYVAAIVVIIIYHYCCKVTLLFPDMGLWVYYRDICGGHSAGERQTQKDIWEASAYMSSLNHSKKENNSYLYDIIWYLYEQAESLKKENNS